MDSQAALDVYFADQLGCPAEALRRRELVVVSSAAGPTPFHGYGIARGRMFARPLWAVQTADGVVISVCQDWWKEIDRISKSVQDWKEALSSERWLPLQTVLQRYNSSLRFVRGFLLYCDRQGFIPCCHHQPVYLPEQHPLRREYGTEVPAVHAIVIGDRVVSHAHIKPPVSDTVWEIAVGTDPEHRGKGYATAVVSAATQLILEMGRIALYQCNEDNVPSLALAHRLGYLEYGRDMLYFEARLNSPQA